MPPVPRVRETMPGPARGGPGAEVLREGNHPILDIKRGMAYDKLFCLRQEPVKVTGPCFQAALPGAQNCRSTTPPVTTSA